MQKLILLIVLLTAVGCTLPKAPEKQYTQFPTLVQLQSNRPTRKSILVGLWKLMDNPISYRAMEIRIQQLNNIAGE